MRKSVDIPTASIRPSEKAVARALGIPDSTVPDERTHRLIGEAIENFVGLAEPMGVVMSIDREVFDRVYRGEGSNEPETPLDEITPEADGFALYAVTVGAAVCREISRLFDEDDFAIGAVLDTATSEGVELAAEAIERQYALELNGSATMAFSPGYCGWHISAQKALFDVLKPDDIGISLTPSCLMEPLKSVSGVVISGAKEIFDFDDAFPFCESCVDRSCRGRIAALADK